MTFLHFGCTSEDINNIVISRNIMKARDDIILPALEKILNILR
jgi:adenylosuccinate lyase